MFVKNTLRNKAIAIGTMLVIASALVFATITPLSPVLLKQNNYQVIAGDLLVTPAACDNVNGNTFAATGKEILLVQNTAGGSGTFTITSVADAYGRVDTSLTAYTVAPAGIAVIQMSQLQGWAQAGNAVNLLCSAATMKFAVLRAN